MIDIPEPYRRILESRVDSILHQYLSFSSPLAHWLFKEVFPRNSLLSIESAQRHVYRDHRRDFENPLAFGETDIEIIAALESPQGHVTRTGLLIETKVDARQMPDQGLRYRARAQHRAQAGNWHQFRCVLTAPKSYLESAYPLGDFDDAGWDTLVALQDIAKVLARTANGLADATVLNQATEPTNAWNKPLPGVSQFWSDLSKFQRAVYPDVPIFINRQQGAGIFVWPSFFENQLASNSREIRRKRVQIVHSGKTHVALFIKKVHFAEFAVATRMLLDEGIEIGDPGGSWQSVRIAVPYVDPQITVESQIDALDRVFEAARRLFDFFIRNEPVLLEIPTFK